MASCCSSTCCGGFAGSVLELIAWAGVALMLVLAVALALDREDE